jgi:hypothetical protein
VQVVRDDVIDGDFAQVMENLQASAQRINDIRELLNISNKLCAKYFFEK